VGADHQRDAKAGGGDIAALFEDAARRSRALAQAQRASERAGRRGGAPAITAHLVRALADARRLRNDLLPLASSGSAWTMMLEVFATQLEGRDLHQRQLAGIVGLSYTSTARVVRHLAAERLLVVAPNPRHRDRLLIRLTGEAETRMRAYLAEALLVSPVV
jgi:hypothetical protein